MPGNKRKGFNCLKGKEAGDLLTPREKGKGGSEREKKIESDRERKSKKKRLKMGGRRKKTGRVITNERRKSKSASYH